jgi:hypothetical protein
MLHESNVVRSSDVTVWSSAPVLVQISVVPTLSVQLRRGIRPILRRAALDNAERDWGCLCRPFHDQIRTKV